MKVFNVKELGASSASYHSGDIAGFCTSEVSNPDDAVALFGAVSPLNQGETASQEV